MGRRLGLKINGKIWSSELSSIDKSIVSKMNLYSNTPIITNRDWDLIIT